MQTTTVGPAVQVAFEWGYDHPEGPRLSGYWPHFAQVPGTDDRYTVAVERTDLLPLLDGSYALLRAAEKELGYGSLDMRSLRAQVHGMLHRLTP